MNTSTYILIVDLSTLSNNMLPGFKNVYDSILNEMTGHRYWIPQISEDFSVYEPCTILDFLSIILSDKLETDMTLELVGVLPGCDSLVGERQITQVRWNSARKTVWVTYRSSTKQNQVSVL